MHMRRLAISKRVSLAWVAEGWTDECFALVMPAGYREFIEFARMGADTSPEANAKVTEFQLQFVKDRLVSGKVLVQQEDGSQVLDDIQPEDVDASMQLADILFDAITGKITDPKVSLPTMAVSPMTEPSSAQPESGNNTKTP